MIRKQHLERVASEYARAGLWTDALAALGRFVDAPAYSGGDPPVTGALVRLMRRLAATPAKERYQTLHDWTMPAKDRRVVRILAAGGARDLAPEAFTRAGSAKPGAARRPRSDDTVLSTADRPDRRGTAGRARSTLWPSEARAAAEQKIENAEALHVIVELARGQGSKVAPRIEARLAELTKENQERAREKPRTPRPGRRNRGTSDGRPSSSPGTTT